MAVTDDQVAALRTYLSARTDLEATDAERQFLTLSRTGHLDAVGALVCGAFAAAARRRFSPTWTSADIIRFVAGFRSSSAEAADLLSPAAAENQLREVLGDQQAIRPPEEARARAQFVLLAALAVNLDARELDGVLAEGRALADSVITADRQSPLRSAALGGVRRCPCSSSSRGIAAGRRGQQGGLDGPKDAMETGFALSEIDTTTPHPARMHDCLLGSKDNYTADRQAVRQTGLLIAAVAERERATVLHYDRDYELIAQVTGQPVQCVIPRGTVP